MGALLPPDIIALAARVVAANIAAGRRLVLAESCTGGLVAAALTEIAGASVVLEGGFVSYDNAAKTRWLGVSDAILAHDGAVSPACVRAMASGALAASHADVAVAVSGVAGPGGGSAEKPVGLVLFGRAVRGESVVRVAEHRFPGLTRAGVRYQAVLVALELLLPESAPAPPEATLPPP